MSRPRSIRLIALLAGALLVAAPALPSPVQASGVADKQREVQRLANQLEALAESVERYAEDYAAAVDEQNTLNGELILARARVADMEAELNELQGNLAGIAMATFVSGGVTNTFADLLTSTGGITDAVQKDHLTRVALDAGADTSDELDALLTRLDAERRDLERKEQRAAQLAEDAEAARQNAERQTIEYQQQYQQAQAELGQALAEEQARREAAALAEAQRIAQANAAAAAAAAAGGGGGGGGGTASGVAVAAPRRLPHPLLRPPEVVPARVTRPPRRRRPPSRRHPLPRPSRASP
jgi:peptidoglycan DL-endopeptidase CwlO